MLLQRFPILSYDSKEYLCAFVIVALCLCLCFPDYWGSQQELELETMESTDCGACKGWKVYPGQVFQLGQAGFQLLPNESFRSPLEI